MNRVLNVHLLPEWADPQDLAGNCAVVIDVLRASTTITTALDSGATAIVPCLTVEEARQLAARRPGAVLGGERQGKPLPGFDFGNSPAEYAPARVAGKSIVFTTTNGTKALMRCTGASQVLVGSLVNRAALCRMLAGVERVDLICAGTDGAFSMEDALAAGAMVDHLMTSDLRRNDAAFVCHALWSQCIGGQPAARHAVRDVLRQSLGGQNLLQLGMADDIDLAAELDRFETIPELDRARWELRPRGASLSRPGDRSR